MDAVEDYARKWIKQEQEWLKAVGSLILKQMKVLNRSMTTNATPVSKDPDVAKTLSTTHDTYVVVPADKAQNNILHPMFIIRARRRK